MSLGSFRVARLEHALGWAALERVVGLTCELVRLWVNRHGCRAELAGHTVDATEHAYQ